MKRMIALMGLLCCMSLGLYWTTADASGKDDFLEKAAKMGLAEVQFGNLAVHRAQSQAVREFAQMMVDDHTRGNQELMSLAASKNVTLPTALDTKHREEFNDLNRRSAAKFDDEFMDEMEDDHEDAVRLFRGASMNHSDADVKAWAAKTLPLLEQHLSMARSIKVNMRSTGSSNAGNANMDMSHGNSNMSDGTSNSSRRGTTNSNSNNMNNSNSNSNRGANRNSNSSNSNSNGNRNGNSNSNRPSNSSNRNSNGNMDLM
jgi:putative membrane protein